jgi:subtilisin
MKQWLDPIRAAEAIRCGRGQGVKIAILDSGVETSHPALVGTQFIDDLVIVEEGRQLSLQPNGGVDGIGHGTAVAGIIHAGAPEAQLGSFRVLNSASRSRTAIILEGAHAAIERGYQIINCSFGSGVKEHWDKFKFWVDEAYLRGVHVVAACNNEDVARVEWPAHFTSVIAVNMARNASSTDLFHRAGSLVEFAARGVDVEVPWTGGGVKTMTGSSFAVPHVTAMLARLLSEAPGLAPLQAKVLLQALARPCVREILAMNDRQEVA